METIKLAILEGQRSVVVGGILFDLLPACPRDTQKNKEKFAELKAIELLKVLNS